MYESKRQPLANRRVFIHRMFSTLLLTGTVVLLSLMMGVLGYHYLAACSWMDAFHNASMILSGMGPVVTIETDSGKLFSSFYALFSGLIFVTNISILLAPVLHRILHKLHLDEDMTT